MTRFLPYRIARIDRHGSNSAGHSVDAKSPDRIHGPRAIIKGPRDNFDVTLGQVREHKLGVEAG